MGGINYLDVLAEENDAAQATIFDERLVNYENGDSLQSNFVLHLHGICPLYVLFS